MLLAGKKSMMARMIQENALESEPSNRRRRTEEWSASYDGTDKRRHGGAL